MCETTNRPFMIRDNEDSVGLINRLRLSSCCLTEVALVSAGGLDGLGDSSEAEDLIRGAVFGLESS